MTRAYAEVIGDPISHSKSPLIHRFWLSALGIDADYSAVQVTSEGLGDYFADRHADPAWRGCNITVPHKVAALDLVPDPGGVRSTIGAMNTVARNDGDSYSAPIPMLRAFMRRWPAWSWQMPRSRSLVRAVPRAPFSLPFRALASGA